MRMNTLISQLKTILIKINSHLLVNNLNHTNIHKPCYIDMKTNIHDGASLISFLCKDKKFKV